MNENDATLRTDRIAKLFDELCEVEPARRAARLGEEEDAGVRRRVERLLQHYDRKGSALEQAVAWEVEPLVAGATEPSESPERIGPYRVQRLLGTGGMGVVYLAEQQNPSRSVAVKVLQAGWLGGECARRFEREAQLLGRLQHPGIAQIFESGTTGEGERAATYIAMEFVDGAPVTEHAAGLGTAERVRLLVDLARAVHHAHLRGVIHRDLKPSNVLVTPEGQVKVIDFGVARALDGDGDDLATLQTRTGQIVGTLAYMSPEQVRGDVGDVDARADVYALGVLAYELFAGALPFDLRDLTLTAAARIVCDEDAALVGTRAPECRGDLEQIVAKALEKEPARRYQSAAALADDLRRYLDDEPVLARPASAIYQLRKVARRHRALVGGTLATLAALLIGAGVAVSYALRNAELVVQEREARADADTAAEDAREQASIAERNAAEAQRLAALAEQRAEESRLLREAAERRTEELKAVSSFQSTVVNEIDPRAMGEGLLEDLRASFRLALERTGADADAVDRESVAFEQALATVNPTEVAVATLERTIFDRAFATLDERFAEGSPTQLGLLLTLGDALANYGLNQRALAAYRRAVDGCAANPDLEPLAMSARLGAAQALYGLGLFEEAERELQAGLNETMARFGDGTDEVRPWLIRLATVAGTGFGDHARAEGLYRRALEGADPHGEDGLRALGGLAGALSERGQFAEAEELQREVYSVYVERYGDRDPRALQMLHLMGNSQMFQGRIEDARATVRQALEGLRETLGDRHPFTARTLDTLSLTYLFEDRLDEAEPLVRESYEAHRNLYGDADPRTLGVLTNLVNIHMRRGEGLAALPLAERAYASSLALWGPGDPRGSKQALMLRDVLGWLHEQDPAAGHDARLREVDRELGRRE